MTSSTLYREGDELAALLAELDGQYPGQVRVVSVDHQRAGGVFGFFARPRVGVHFALTEDGDHGAPADIVRSPRTIAPAPAAASAGDPLADLIAAAERGEHPAPALANAEFAAMVMELAATKSLQRPTTPSVGTPSIGNPADPDRLRTATFEPLPAFSTPPMRPDARRTPDVETVRSPGLSTVAEPSAWVPEPGAVNSGRGLALRRKLAELGVPIEWLPSDAQDARSAIDEVVQRFPHAPAPPTGAGEVLAIVGPGAAARHAAEALRVSLGLDPAMVWTPGGATPTPGGTQLGDPCCVRAFVQSHRISSGRPAIVVIATDLEGRHAAAVAAPDLDTIAPDAVWAVVDAAKKPADVRRALAVGRPADALIVSFSARTSSPATVCDLGVPVAMLGAVPATRTRWATVLLDAYALLEA